MTGKRERLLVSPNQQANWGVGRHGTHIPLLARPQWRNGQQGEPDRGETAMSEGLEGMSTRAALLPGLI